ncbi:PaaI family thioesterase [Corynebacterium sp. H128]|uniref:PaaI family thioesterase n=1 Tax=unclassified Corynebacterium TaxID=2624378 RepID=UPI0030B5957C
MEISQLFAQAKERPLSQEELAALSEANRGFAQLIGIRFVHVSTERVQAEIPVTQDLLQVAGLVNGGVYCSIGETLGSIAGLCAAGGRPVVGINNSTNFIASCGSGVIEAEAVPVHLGHSTQTFEIKCFHRDRLLAQTMLRTMVLGG